MLKEASPKENLLLQKMEIFDEEGVLEHLPRRYEDMTLCSKEEFYHFLPGKKYVFLGRLSSNVVTHRFAKASKSTFYFKTHLGADVNVIAWNRPYLGKMLLDGETYTLQGSYDEKNHAFNLITFKKGDFSNRLIPVYSLPNAYPEHRFVRLVSMLLEKGVGDIVPASLREKHRLPTRLEAFRLAHFPESGQDLARAFRYFKYEEALLFTLRNAISKKAKAESRKAVKKKIDKKATSQFVNSLPYALTADQRTALLEALRDMDSPHVMYRLLQGDVGTGKTLVSGILMFANWTRSLQSAIMAPTEALARQHYQTLSKLFGDKLRLALLLGSTPTAERKAIVSGIKAGEIDVAIGTHALFSEDVEYRALGLVIIDEQHKFGVRQRMNLAKKGEEVDLLSMSATPIPRTLALTLYGDMDVSTLEVFPSAKREVETFLIDHKDPRIKKALIEVLSEDGQIYVVAPQIEDRDEPGFISVKKLYDSYYKAFPMETVLLHGQMKAEEKEAALEEFVSGRKRILVATSLIEVGIDVPKARLLIVYEASHFSLSSLHQLRGRIGRDGHKATCLLIEDSTEEDRREKLEVLVHSEDGFEISKADLGRRGFGELAGTKQSGLVDLRFASIVDDYKVFLHASNDASNIVADEDNPSYQMILKKAKGSISTGD